MCRGSERRWLRNLTQFQHADVVVAGDEQSAVGGGLQVEGELAVFGGVAVDAAGKLQHHGLQAGVFPCVPHLYNLQ